LGGVQIRILYTLEGGPEKYRGLFIKILILHEDTVKSSRIKYVKLYGLYLRKRFSATLTRRERLTHPEKAMYFHHSIEILLQRLVEVPAISPMESSEIPCEMTDIANET
jgi:hypothetical protein